MAASGLAGATVVVTGASSGIGEATAHAAAEQGATVALLARRRDRLDALAGSLRDGGATVLVEQVDVTDADGVRAALDAVVEQAGSLDVLVNNAGWGRFGRARDAALEDWRRMVEVNVLGVLTTTHAALPHLLAAAQGPRGVADVVTVSSVAGRRTSPVNNVYAATKHAVGAFSDSLRQELAEAHVRVGLVEPGLVRTELTEGGGPTGELPTEAHLVLEAEEIADAVVYMASRRATTAVNEILVRPTEQSR
ncbi:SDR family oxidoreductase [Rhodococcus aerolatus]